MSETSTEEVTPTTPAKWFGASDFAHIKIASPVLASGATDVSADQARQIIRARLTDAAKRAGGYYEAGGGPPRWMEGIAEAIVQALPAEAMYSETVQNLDLRPYIQVTVDYPDAKPRSFDGWFGTEDDAIPEMGTTVLEGLQQQYDEVVGEKQLGSDRTPEEVAASKETWRTFDPSTAGYAPEAAMAHRAQQVAETAGSAAEAEAALLDEDPYAALVEEATTIAPITFPEDQLRQMLRTGELGSLIDLGQQEAAFNADNGTMGYVPVELGMTGSPDVPGVDRVKQRTLNANDAIDWIHNLSEEEVSTIQQQLAKAGYFDQLNGFDRYEEGYQYDAATGVAWQLALADSVKQNKPLPVLLAERTAAETKRRQDQFAAFSTSSSRKAANQLAIDAIGRELEPDEYEMVRTYLVDLRDQRAKAVTGIDDVSWRNDETATTGYGEEDVYTAVERVVAPEIASAASWNAGQKLYQFMGVDFPGTQRTED